MTLAAEDEMLHKLGSQGLARRLVVGKQPLIGQVGLIMAGGVAYFLAAQLGLMLLTPVERVAVFWPAAGIAAGLLIALGPWVRAPVAVVVVAASVAASLLSDRSIWSAIAFALCNAAEALMAMWLIGRWFGPAFDLASLRRVLGFFAAAAVATATSAVAAAGAMNVFGPSTAAFLDVWKIWFASDALGIITVAPLLIGVAATVRDPPSWRELLEGTAAVVILTATIGVLLALLSGPWSVIGPGAFLFPLLLWLGYRCRPVFAAAAVFAIAATVVWTTTHDFGRYGDPIQPMAVRVSAAQIAMLGITLAALALAALFAERRRHEAAIVASEARLRSILDAANVIAWDVDLTRNTVDSAGPVARLLDRPKGSAPRDFAAMVETIHPDDRDSVMAKFWTAVSSAANYRLEFRLKSDRLCWVTAEGSIERDAAGRAVRVRGITQDITERKRTELALAEHEAHLGLAGRAARVGSFVLDYATERIRISPGYAVIHGLAEGTEELTREEWRARVLPDDLPRLDAVRGRVFAERSGELHIEYRVAGAEGEVRWIESRGLVSYDGNGRPARLVGVHIDITERKLAEAALERSEARYRALYNDNPSMYFTVDASGKVLSVNEFGAQQLGYAPAELVGRSVLEMIHEGDREGARRWLASCVENAGAIARAEMRKLRRDGSTIWVRKLARVVKGFGGQALLIACEDITERKQAELALAERGMQLALAAKAALVGSFAYDVGADVLQVEEGYAALHGLPDGTTSTPRSAWQSRVHPEDLPRFEAIRSQAFSDGQSEYGIEYRIVRSTGEVRWVETRCFISYGGDGRADRVVGVSIDISERKRVEEQQLRLVAELDHRVKNVLATVQAVAAQTMRANSSMEHFVAAFDGRIRSMGSTHELLSRRRWADIPLAELVERELAPYAAHGNTEITGPDVMLSAEAAQSMAMVLHELVTNAAKYGALSTREGRVSVCWQLSAKGDADARLCIEWQETGGPAVRASERCGYGMEVIRNLPCHELDGKVDVVFAAEGVKCRFDIRRFQPARGDRLAGTLCEPLPNGQR